MTTCSSPFDLSARGERYTGFVWHGGAHESMQGLDTFADGLEDFIAESRFAWGQQRLLRDRPWRTGE